MSPPMEAPESIPCPPRFSEHVFTRAYEVPVPWQVPWSWLMTPETFTKGQVWPFRVEFLDTPLPDGRIARGFDVGTLNAHHGPFMNFCGRITRVETGPDGGRRDLHYDYGAYALAFRLIRPTLLRVEATPSGPTTSVVTVRIESHVRRGLHRAWTLAQRCFWPGFGLALRKACRRATQAPS